MVWDRVVCINMAERPERWSDFINQEWPSALVNSMERIEAIVGKKCKAPVWWKQGNGAWGCYRTHLRILEDAINSGVNSYLVFEDDAILCDDFQQKYNAFMAALPDDWQMIYLGGQHLQVNKSPPIRVKPGVVFPYNVNRTHAFGVRGEEMMVALYRHLNATKDWRNRFHIDHHLGLLHQLRIHKIYCPEEFIVGQRGGMSNVSCTEKERMFWNGHVNQIVDPPSEPVKTRNDVLRTSAPKKQAQHKQARPTPLDTPFVAVLGTHSSGSSCIALMLIQLGIHMGNDFIGCWDGGGEARGLASMLERAMPFPEITKREDDRVLESRLRPWVASRCREAKAKKTIAGGKYPHLCEYAWMLPGAFGEKLRIINCDRPLEESIRSIIQRCPNKPAQKLRAVQERLHYQKIEFLNAYRGDVLTLKYDDVLKDPKRAVNDIISYLGITPTTNQLENAIAVPDAGKRHIQKIS